MTATAPQAEARPAPSARPSARARSGPQGIPSKVWAAPLWGHTLVLAAVLLVLLVASRPDRLFNADEGAAASQAHTLAEGEGWTRPHPLPQVDPDGTAFPIHLSAQRDGSLEFAPFAKHPVYPLLLSVPMRAGGVALAATVSVIGTVVAAFSAGLLARRLWGGLDRAALWTAGLASPLLFDSFVMIAHTLGAAMVGLALVVVLAHRDRPRPAHLMTLASVLLVGVMLRNEVILLGLALGAVLVTDGALRRLPRSAVLGAVALGATVVGYLVDAQLQAVVLGGDDVRPFVIDSSSGMIADRWHALKLTLLSPPDGDPAAMLCAVLATALLVAAVLVARRRDADMTMVGLLSVLAGAAAVAWAVQDPIAVVPGLLFAFPLGVAGVLGLGRREWSDPSVRLLGGVVALFVVGVLATQYRNSGVAWGGRYFAIVLPVFAALAVAGLRRTGNHLSPEARRAFGIGAAMVALAFLVVSVGAVRYRHDRDVAMAESFEAATAGVVANDGDPRPVVVATDDSVGRLSWRLVDEQRWLLVDASQLPEYAQRLSDAGIERFVLIDDDLDSTLAAVDELYVASGDPFRTTMNWPGVGMHSLAPVAQVVELR